jgi:hypothetical protein
MSPLRHSRPAGYASRLHPSAFGKKLLIVLPSRRERKRPSVVEFEVDELTSLWPRAAPQNANLV